jgi:hypothetical protein
MDIELPDVGFAVSLELLGEKRGEKEFYKVM